MECCSNKGECCPTQMDCCATKGSCGSCEKPEDTKHQQVSTYYGKTLTGTADLKTSCCTTADTGLTAAVKKARSMLHDEVMGSFYGCGSPIPPAIEGSTVLDLGVFALFQLLTFRLWKRC